MEQVKQTPEDPSDSIPSENLGISVRMIVESMCKALIDKLREMGEDVEEYIRAMCQSVRAMVKQKIEELENLFKSIKTTAENIAEAAPIWSTQLAALPGSATIDPVGSAASIADIKNSVSIAKANMTVASTQLSTLNMGLSGFGLSVPVVDTLSTSIDAANFALNLIPL